jgi:hypothetical protein
MDAAIGAVVAKCNFDDPELQAACKKWQASWINLPKLQDKWVGNLGKPAPELAEKWLARDLSLVDFLSKSFSLPAYRLTRLAEEVVAWRVEDHWLFCHEEKLRWARNAMKAGNLNPQERKQLEADMARREREHDSRMAAHKEESRRIFDLQPRIYAKEIFAAARSMAANEKAESYAQRQNQHEVLADVRSKMDDVLDQLLALGVSLEEIEELKNG